MNRLFWVLLILYLPSPTVAQRNADYGVYGGVSTYLGDINPNRLLYSPMPSAGFFYRYNLHSRQAVRLSLYHGLFSASDNDFDNLYQQNRGFSFNGQISELAIQYEFNFFPYSTEGGIWDFTPYFSTGAGIAMFNSQITSFQPVVPFTIGFKANIYKNLGLETEYGFRKTFYDNFDGLKDNVSASDYAVLHNNDWYFFSGIAFTWKLYDRRTNCAAYNDVVKNRRR